MKTVFFFSLCACGTQRIEFPGNHVNTTARNEDSYGSSFSTSIPHCQSHFHLFHISYYDIFNTYPSNPTSTPSLKPRFISVTQLCPTLFDPMNHSTLGLPVHYQLLEFTQTNVHGVGDTIQPSHPLSSPCPPALNLSYHQGLFK